MKIRSYQVMILAIAVCAASQAQTPPPNIRIPVLKGGFPPLQTIEGVPAFKEQSLKLIAIPEPTGPRESLFNGKDLNGFTPWLGYANGSLIPADANNKPLGATGMGDVYKVVTEDGYPAIYISGRIWGALTTKREFSNYHLSLKYKFRRQWGAEPPNSGVLYHSYGDHDDFGGTFMSSIEFEIRQNVTGMIAPIGRAITAEVEVGKGPDQGLFPGLEDLRYMPGGKLAEIHMPTMVKEARDVEQPVGQWNSIDLYVAGDKTVHVVNGVPTIAASKLSLKNEGQSSKPLTRGKLQLESEGTEIFMRDIWIEPIDSVPQVVVGP